MHTRGRWLILPESIFKLNKSLYPGKNKHMPVIESTSWPINNDDDGKLGVFATHQI